MLLKNIIKSEDVVNFFKGHLPGIQAFLLNIIIAIVILLIGKIIIKNLLKVVKKVLIKSSIEVSVRKFIDSLLKAIMYIILIMIIADRVGIQTTSFLAILGSAGLAIGLALQGSLSNFAGGVLILIIKPFKVGDYIVDGGSGKEGTVQKIDLFYTSLITTDNKLVVVPNGMLSNSEITNATAFEKRRLDLSVGISYGNDMKKAKDIVEEVVRSTNYPLEDKELLVIIKELRDSAVIIEARIWLKTDDYWTAKFELTEKIKNKFDEENIEIPFNQMQVHLVQK